MRLNYGWDVSKCIPCRAYVYIIIMYVYVCICINVYHVTTALRLDRKCDCFCICRRNYCFRSDDVNGNDVSRPDDGAILWLRGVRGALRGESRGGCHGGSILRAPGDWPLSASGLRDRITETRPALLRLFGGRAAAGRPQVQRSTSLRRRHSRLGLRARHAVLQGLAQVPRGQVRLRQRYATVYYRPIISSSSSSSSRKLDKAHLTGAQRRRT